MKTLMLLSLYFSFISLLHCSDQELFTKSAYALKEIKVSQSVSDKLVEKFNYDFQLLQQLDLNESKDPKFLSELELKQWKTTELISWFKKRVSYILSPYDIELRNSDGAYISSDFSYSNDSTTIFTNLSLEAIKKAQFDSSEKFTSLRVLLKDTSVSYIVKPSPRKGILLMNEQKVYQIENQTQLYLHESFYRLGNFFHEARHSDEMIHQKSYKHIQCPSGHDYEGQNACDQNLYGSYHVEASLLKNILRACNNCQRWDSIRIKTRILDSISRVITLKENLKSKEELIKTIFPHTKMSEREDLK